MAGLACSWFEGIPNTVRKKRTLRPRPTETQPFIATPDESPSPLSSPFDETTKPNSDLNGGPTRTKISQWRSRNHVRTEGKTPENKLVQEGSHCALFVDETNQIGRVAHGNHQSVPGLSNSKEPANGFMIKAMKGDNHRANCDAQPIYGHSGIENENKLKRVNLKADGSIHTTQGNAAPNDNLNGYCATDYPSSEGLRSDQKRTPWKDFARGDFPTRRNDCSMGRPRKSKPSKQVEKLEPVRKSKRAPNRHVLDLTMEDEEVDDEIRFLEKLRNARNSIGRDEDEDDDKSSRKHQKYSRVSEISMVTGNCSEVSENMENEDQEAAPPKSKENDTSADLKRNTILTARQRALQSGRGGPSSPDTNLEFPNGLPAATSKKKKDSLSEKELLKKAEAAQKRKLQNEKAAQKCQEDAIRKILSQDSSKKKKEDQRKKRLEELAEEKAAEAIKHQSDTVRVVMGPTGTIVSFGENCIPSIFTAKPSSYPPPRESCAGPSCSNPYKYRDSKSKLPLCSLKCYKAVRERLDKESSC